MTRLSREQILALFGQLNDELAGGAGNARQVGTTPAPARASEDKQPPRTGAIAELYLVGGAVMCLALDARDSIRDVYALFRPASVVREAAARVAARAGVPTHWLNDAVKAFLSPRGSFDPFLELSNLRVYVAQPTYLLAMKCAAMRLGAEFHDLEDVRYLLRYLNITSVAEAVTVITRYFDEEQLPVKTRLALEEMLGPPA